jgi:glucose/arabinose dehydrogenase
MGTARRTAVGITISAVLALAFTAAAPHRAAAQQLFDSWAEPFVIEPVATGLAFPWGMAFLPDGTFLVTERPGRLNLVAPETGTVMPVAGVPDVYTDGQGGLLDVIVGPDFQTTGRIYFTFAEPGDGGTAGTAAASARLVLDGDAPRLEDVDVIFRQEPKVAGGEGFGSRIVMADDGNLFVTLGERDHPEFAQDTSNHLGSVVRVAPDGHVPKDNPFVGQSATRPEIWSFGHSNVQGADVDPASGALWTIEHDSSGGDEVNHNLAGRNYGWPRVSYGVTTSGTSTDPAAMPGLEPAVYGWNPSISPTGLAFYDGDLFPNWRGNLFVGSLTAQALVRLELSDGAVVREERLIQGELGSIRDVSVGPEGAIYLLTDHPSGGVFRLVPPPRG